MKLKETQTFEAALYIGNREGYHGPKFSRQELEETIQTFQDDNPDIAMPCRVMDCTYLMGRSYREDGWEVSSITYPNRSAPQSQVLVFIQLLSKHLLKMFGQNRITVRCVKSDTPTFMWESEQAEDCHTK